MILSTRQLKRQAMNRIRLSTKPILDQLGGMTMRVPRFHSPNRCDQKALKDEYILVRKFIAAQAIITRKREAPIRGKAAFEYFAYRLITNCHFTQLLINTIC